MAVSGVRGSIAAGLNLIYNTLMADALDEVSTEYGLLAEVGQASAGLLERRPIGCAPMRAGTTASRSPSRT